MTPAIPSLSDDPCKAFFGFPCSMIDEPCLALHSSILHNHSSGNWHLLRRKVSDRFVGTRERFASEKAFDGENHSSLIISIVQPDPARMCRCALWLSFPYSRSVQRGKCRWSGQCCRCCCTSDRSVRCFCARVWVVLIHFLLPRNENVFSACDFFFASDHELKRQGESLFGSPFLYYFWHFEAKTLSDLDFLDPNSICRPLDMDCLLNDEPRSRLFQTKLLSSAAKFSVELWRSTRLWPRCCFRYCRHRFYQTSTPFRCQFNTHGCLERLLSRQRLFIKYLNLIKKRELPERSEWTLIIQLIFMRNFLFTVRLKIK